MQNARSVAVADSLVSIGVLSQSNAILYAHSLPERLLDKIECKLGQLDQVSRRALRVKREVGCSSKQ